MTIPPDTKDWTWVLQRPCPDCGFDAADLAPDQLAARFRATLGRWGSPLEGPGATTRPDPRTWSPTEYACHVRDVHRVFARRLRLMLERDDPLFDNWDQDETALADRYDLQDPATVAGELLAAGEEAVERYAAVRPDQWQRAGRRSNGSVFTVATLGAYHLHDVEHHLWDVGA